MMDFFQNIIEMTGFNNLLSDPGYIVMLIMGCLLLFLGISKKYEPLLLVPIGFGVIIANIPNSNLGVVQVDQSYGLIQIASEHGIINLLYYSLIKTGFLPPLIFMGIGALTDFGPMLKNLRLVFFGAAAQIGIFSVLILASLFGFSNNEAAALAIIGGADGPTAIYTSIILAPHLLGPIAIAAYSYMALVPVIIPSVVKVLVTKKELLINMKKQDDDFSDNNEIKNLDKIKIIFPILVTLIVSMIVPSSTTLIGFLMFGNLLKEIGSSTIRLSKSISDNILNSSTLFLGLTIGATMTPKAFLNIETIAIIFGGLFAFIISIAGGIIAVKIYNLFSKKKINPLIGATGLSAVPMASRVANEIALKNDPSNHLMNYAMASNISGVIGSAVAAGVLISYFS
ncbi:MAG: glutaconyl-CoA decarboxylase subunit beta [Rhodothermaeota bacterium MED-G18]|nr:glutaconyl-CoA decarboxylase subunit beta [Marinoscillum sp.]OUX27073.1 MAG: glutaconyl-CoA decarboxylase subunit beta [Flammeovirgaceae bacterium TMED262]PDH45439.1 MAG: glutaconyl-CoA decarboxylase subunit beta [Rhodothermaeota bacterium MED-G18]